MDTGRTPEVTAYPPLESLTQPNVSTDQAAFYLLRKPQTLRIWACRESGPIRPVRLHGRLSWRVTEIKALLNGSNS